MTADDALAVGTAVAEPGERATGSRHVAELPVGGDVRLPVIVVNGAATGPTVWVTAGIHGDEPTGTVVAHDVVDRIDVDALAGRVVCLPVMNPDGFRRNRRTASYHDDDPNRYFGREPSPSGDPPRVQHQICERIYEDIRETADALVALHTSWVATHPYTIRPRVPYGTDRDTSAAIALRDDIAALTDAFGLPVVTQFDAATTAARELDYALAGAAVADGIPAFTPELGGRLVVERDVAAAAVDGLWNVFAALGMVAEPVTPAARFDLALETDHKRFVGPHAPVAGIVRYRVTEGSHLTAGDPVADIVDAHGTVQTTVTAPHDGVVLSRRERAAVYANDPLFDLAIPDDDPLLVEST